VRDFVGCTFFQRGGGGPLDEQKYTYSIEFMKSHNSENTELTIFFFYKSLNIFNKKLRITNLEGARIKSGKFY